MAPTKATKVKKTPVKFSISCEKPAEDGIFDIPAFEKFLHSRIKVNGRTNNLSDTVTITTTNGSITVVAQPSVTFSKRYLKYLTKKFLKKNQLRDWLRVVADAKGSYTLKYYNVAAGEEADEE